jgi:hypothetical protein
MAAPPERVGNTMFHEEDDLLFCRGAVIRKDPSAAVRRIGNPTLADEEDRLFATYRRHELAALAKGINERLQLGTPRPDPRTMSVPAEVEGLLRMYAGKIVRMEAEMPQGRRSPKVQAYSGPATRAIAKEWQRVAPSLGGDYHARARRELDKEVAAQRGRCREVRR